MNTIKRLWGSIHFWQGVGEGAAWAIIITALLALLLLAYDMAHAESGPFLDIAGGLTHFLVTATDGDYVQRGLPHSFDLRSAAYRVQLGWRFNERWSIQGGYINLGTINQSAKFVGDEHYDAKANRCVNYCAAPPPYKLTDAYHGGEVTLSRHWSREDYDLFLKGGGAYLMHRLTYHKQDGSGTFGQNYGQFPAVVVGTGISYKWAYLEVDYYHGLGGSNGFMGQDQGWPLSKEMIVTWFGFKVPFGG